MSEIEWVPVEERLPESHNQISKFSEELLLAVLDTEWSEEEAKKWRGRYEYELEKYTVRMGYLFRPGSGGMVWLSYDQTPIEDFKDIVTHWAKMPGPPKE